MPMYWNEDQDMLADSARPFIAGNAPVSHMRALRDAGDSHGFSPDVWRQFAEMGFTGILAGEADDGLGLGHVEAGIVLEEIGRNLTPSPFLSTAVGAVTALNMAGDHIRQRWMPGIVAGESVAALAFEETTRHRPHRVAATATKSGNGFRLDGAKQFVAHGHVADVLLVTARSSGDESDRDGITLFAVPRDTDGVTADADRLADASMAARVMFDGVEVDGDAVVGEVGRGADVLDRVLGAVRTGAAAELVGVANGAADMTTAYLRERKQFGQIIGSFQALQHRAAHLYCEMEVARAAVLKAQQALDEGDPEAERHVHVAKAMAGNSAALAVQEAVQMHGGIGMTDEYDVGFYMKRQRVLAEMFGDADYHADRLARLSGY
ncbi:acyl-CoA dehydrogenase family protein [uncultured Croceicoccus sp.]|uniref:acyl-CoA dehydrogenase family protein n=1 Tax=uncultured Croceicoccus sp. TaxID=1295329 RepID=UPI0026102127|nr:acyl-CoA dehydrogenase family protein [uncultured Croceicoccus sp.]